MQASMLVTLGIGGLAVLVASGFVLSYSTAVSHTGGSRVHARMRARSTLLLWMTLFALLAERGVLARFEQRPPPFVIAMIVIMAVSVGLGLSPVGEKLARGLSLTWLVMAQGFRLPLELVMHQAASEGVMPVEMSYRGYNFDIFTGFGALVVGWLLYKRKASRGLVYAWNVMGSLLLANVVTIAVIASPLVRAFGDDPAHVNTWVAQFPFIWLPAVLVAAAVLGHVVIFRALHASWPEPSSAPPSLAPPSSS